MQYLDTAITVLALVTALAAWLAKLRWSKEFAQAKNAEIDALRQQLQNLQDINPKVLREHTIALREQMEEHVSLLNAALAETRAKLEKTRSEVTDELRAVASIFGQARAIFGIAEVELHLRRLASFLLAPHVNVPIDYGDRDHDVHAFYLNAVSFLIPNADVAGDVAEKVDEWLLDFVLQPLLLCVRFPDLKPQAAKLYQYLCDGFEARSKLAYEVPVYREYLDVALAGGDVSAGLSSECFRETQLKHDRVTKEHLKRQALGKYGKTETSPTTESNATSG